MNRKSFVPFIVVALIVFMSSQVMAQGGRIHTGNLKIIPGISVLSAYDDNIYLGSGTNATTELEEEDWITHFKPGILLDYTFDGRGRMGLGYQGDFAYYSDNDDNDWQAHDVLFDFDYQSPGGLIVGFTNKYRDSEDPYGNDSEYKLGISKTERWTNDLRSKIGGCLFGNNLMALAYFNYYEQDYDDDVNDYTQDYDQNELGVGLQMRFLPKTWGFLRYHFGDRDYNTHSGTSNETNDSDFDWHRVNTGLMWDSGGKISGELNLGYQWKNYDNILAANGTLYDDKDTWIAATSVNFEVSQTTNISININRALKETASDTNEYYEDTGLGINLSQQLLAKLSLVAGFMVSENEYNLNNREDDNLDINIKVDYKMQDWLNAGIGYEYKEKDSESNSIVDNFGSNNEFEDNRVVFTISAVY